MTTAIANLIENAIEAMENPPKLLETASRAKDAHIEILVSDNGKGIPEDRLRYIFDPFFTSKVYGPGLGLTFARSIVEEHKGNIFAESEPGKGTTVTIVLPLKIF